MNKYSLKLNSWKCFILLLCFPVLTTFAVNYLFITEELYYNLFSDTLAVERITSIIEQSQKWQWLGYLFIPIVILIRVSFTAICLYIGLFLDNIKVRFKDLFKIALLADFVFVLAGLAKLVILIFFKEVSTLDDLQFQPLSLIEVFDRKSVDALMIYPLSLINVFELLYWLVLAWLLTGVTEKSVGNSLKTVASSYGTGLFLWLLFVIFLTVNLI